MDVIGGGGSGVVGGGGVSVNVQDEGRPAWDKFSSKYGMSRLL